MAASSKVNASVEQANVSSGWDEAHGEVSAGPVPLEVKINSAPRAHMPESDARNFQANFKMVQRRLRDYLAQSKTEGRRIAKALGGRLRWLRYEHPGYVVGAAAVSGFACGLVLRARRSRK